MFTICWDCKNACGNCSWSKNLKPVEGWEALEVPPKAGYNYQDSNNYVVQSCPLFERDAKHGGQMRIAEPKKERKPGWWF